MRRGGSLPVKLPIICERIYCCTLFIFVFGTMAYFVFLWCPPQPTDLHADVIDLIPELLDNMKWSYWEKVLQFGSGRGELGHYLILPTVTRYGSEMYSVDYQQSNVEYAMKNFASSNVKYTVGNIYSENRTEFPYWNLKFDKIFAIDTFQLVPNLEKLLNRFREVLKPGGLLAFTTTTANNLFVKLNLRLSQNSKWQNYMQRYREKYYPAWSTLISKFGVNQESLMKSLFKKAGFRVLYLSFRTTEYKSQSINGTVEHLIWQTPAYEGIPNTKLADLKEDIRKMFLNMTGLAPDAEDFDLENERILGILEGI